MQICAQFHANPSVNPVTGRQISIGGPAYRDLVSRCGPPPSLQATRSVSSPTVTNPSAQPMALPSTVMPLAAPCPPCPNLGQTQQITPSVAQPTLTLPLIAPQRQSSFEQSARPPIQPTTPSQPLLTVPSIIPQRQDAPAPVPTIQPREPVAEGTSPLVISQEVQDRCVAYEIGRADEDRHFAARFGPVRFYGVFDGHGGPKTRFAPSNSVTANFLRDNFPQKFYSKLSRLNLNDQNQVRQAINETFFELDRELYERGDAGETGATAGVALITPTRLYLINLGDSRSVVFDNQGRVILETQDNKPNDPQERARIESLGGSVNFYMGTYRVNNSLAVSRAFGDYGLKRSNKSAGYDPQGWVSVVPDIYMMDLPPNPRALYLVMASDGLWDGFSSEEVARFLTERSMTGSNLCSELVSVARTRTTDDVTAILVDV